MEDVDADDTHICLKCRTTIEGLDNYVRHRKYECGGKKSEVRIEPNAVVELLPSLEEHHEPNLKADDFFSSLELQSSSKKPVALPTTPTPPRNFGVLTRSKAVVRGAGREDQTQREAANEDLQIIGEILRTSESDLIKKHEDDEFDEDSNDEYIDFEMLDDDDHAPPRSHTGGKWKPGGQRASPSSWSRPSSSRHVDEDRGGPWGLLLLDNTSPAPPPTFTGGKWKPTTPTRPLAVNPLRPSDDEDEDVPPPDHVSGKWAPGRGSRHDGDGSNTLLMSPYRKSPSNAMYWCGPCNRNLSSRHLYDKHLKSDLHYRRTLQERELDQDFGGSSHVVKEVPQANTMRGEGKRVVKKTEIYENTELIEGRKRKLKPSPTKTKKRKKHRVFVKCEVCHANVCSMMMGKHLVSYYHRRKAMRHDAVNESLLLANIHSVVRQAPFQCSPCKFYAHTMDTFKTHWNSDMHLRNDAKFSGRYWCSICKCVCETSSDMGDHFDTADHKESILSMNQIIPIIIQRRQTISCWTCDEVFQYNAELRRHCLKTLHPDFNSAEDQRFFCGVCKYRAQSRRALQRHGKMAHKDGAECFCSVCGLNFATAKEAVRHRKSQLHKVKAEEDRRSRGLEAKKMTRTCRHCGSHFNNPHELKTHLHEEHPELSHRCPHCGASFSFHQELSAHIRARLCAKVIVVPEPCSETVEVWTSQGDGADMQCRHCGFIARSRAEFHFHDILHGRPVVERDKSGHQVVKYPCSFCEKAFRKSSLLGHVSQHVGGETNVRKFCAKSFGYRSSLLTHMKMSHASPTSSDAVFACEASRCSHVAASAAALERHRLRHTDREKPFLCALCGASFRLKHNLQQHIKLHTGKEYKCEVSGCIFECRSRAELKNHQQVHSDERPHQCQDCQYAAKTKPQLVRHQLIHKGVKDHICPHCPFRSRISSHLRRHLRLHTGSKPYRCPYCTHTCNILENLRKHILTTSKHPGKKMYECKLCPDGKEGSAYATNMAKEFKVHLVNLHADTFKTSRLAAEYIAGVYEHDVDDAEDDVVEQVVLPLRQRRNQTAPKRLKTRRVKKETEEMYEDDKADGSYIGERRGGRQSMDGVVFIPTTPEITSLDEQGSTMMFEHHDGDHHQFLSINYEADPDADSDADADAARASVCDYEIISVDDEGNVMPLTVGEVEVIELSGQ